ncbi:hypothetical protein BK744_01785 [Bacillus thuringiensis serovar zhaodongensis]|uniref:MFS transporter n=1 Tax=Bacillus thuringiensis TaxID=1428 RepID=UPI000A3AB947|nr:MFS transporter [Bacillus thuringiensis]OUB80581.1 hypothetical protein BK744_01785 [Bacillus thuringiensis serovar zhaodongensis]
MIKLIIDKFKFKSEYLLLLKENPDFLKLFIANVLSKIGTQMHRFGLPWLVYNISGSGKLMAINFTISLIPGFFFGFIGGVLSDKLSRKKILIIGDIIASLFTLLILIIYFSPYKIEVWHLFLLTFVLSSINAIYLPSFEAGLPTLIKKEDIIKANGLFSISQSFIELGGPAISGILIGFFNPLITIGINSISFFISALILINIKSKKFTKKANIKEKNNNIVSDIKYCMSYIFETKWLLYGLILTFGIYLGTGSVGSLIQFYLRDSLGLSGVIFGISFSLFEFLPMLIMGYYAPILGEKYSMEKMVLIGSLVYSLSLISMGITTIYPIVIISGMLLNGSLILIIVNWNTMRQKRTPNHVLGRVTGIIMTFQYIALPIGGSVSSFLITFMSVQIVLILFGIIALTTVIIIYFTPFTYNEDPLIVKTKKEKIL